MVARIIAVVDAYDAMAVDRVYRKAPGHNFALIELRRCAGTQFDPAVVEAFISIVSPPEELTDPPSLRSIVERNELSGDDITYSN